MSLPSSKPKWRREAAGFTMGSDGYFQKGGQEVKLTIISPSAYTDMAEVDSIAAQELRAAENWVPVLVLSGGPRIM